MRLTDKLKTNQLRKAMRIIVQIKATLVLKKILVYKTPASTSSSQYKTLRGSDNETNRQTKNKPTLPSNADNSADKGNSSSEENPSVHSST